MVDYSIDMRDLDFVLNEQLRVESLTGFTAFSDMSRDTFDMIVSEGARFAVEVMGPLNAPADAEGCRIEDGRVVVPEGFQQGFDAMVAGGWVAPCMTPELGGMGLPFTLHVVLQEMFVGGCGSLMFFSGLTASAGHLLENFFDRPCRDMLVSKLYTGEWTGTMCLTEPQAGSAVGDLKTSAVPVENSDLYAVTGNKIFISAGDHELTDNIIHLVLARVPGDPEGTRGISLFVVPKYRFDDAGNVLERNDVTVTGIEHKMGINGSPTCSLSFGDEGQCHGYLVGERCKGIVYMFQMMNESRLMTGVQGVASANAAYQLALAYARDRIQGPSASDRSDNPKSVSIIEHPDVRRNLMLAKSHSEGIRALCLETAYQMDLSRYSPDDAVRARAANRVDLMTPVCKAFSSDVGFKVAELAVQVHGGYGYIKEYGVEQCLRDVKIASLYEGTNGIQALDLLGRKMRMKDGTLFMEWLQDINEMLAGLEEHAELGGEVARVLKARDCLASTAMSFQGMIRQNPQLVLLRATPFLEMFGTVEVARLLLGQAVIADTALREILQDAGARDEVAVAGLIERDTDGRYYDGKVKTARFFIQSVLPRVHCLAREIESNDTSALDIVF